MGAGVPINGKVLAEFRYLRALTQEDVAFACYNREGIKVAREEISAYEREEAYPTQAKLLAICAVLDIQVGSAEWRALIRTPTLDKLLDADRQQADQKKEAQEEDADRHEFLNAAKSGATTAVLAGWAETVERITSTLGRPSRVDQSCLDLLEQQTTVMEAAFSGPLPIDVLLAQARAHLDGTLRLLDGSLRDSTRHRLSIITGATASLVGALSRIAGLWGGAHQAFATAAALGHAVGHPGLEARALACQAQLYSDTGWPTDAKTAKDYAEQADALRVAAGGRMDAPSRSWLAVELARCKLASKDPTGFHAEVAEAFAHLDGQHAAEVGGRFVGRWDTGDIERAQGRGLLRLHKPSQARTILEHAISNAQGRKRLLWTIDLAEAFMLADEPEQACQLLTETFTASVHQHYGLALGFIAQTRNRMHDKWNYLSCVQQLDQQLQLYRAAGLVED
jgi:transcriptional regulator with XRE-family HTH domain